MKSIDYILNKKIIKNLEYLEQQNPQKIGQFYMIFQAFCFFLANIFIKLMKTGPFQIINHGGILMFTVSYFYLKSQKINVYFKDKKSHNRLLLRGFFGVLNFCFQLYAIKTIPLSEATTLIYTMPIFTGILGTLFLKEKLKVIDFFIYLSGIAGVIFIVQPPFIFQYFQQEKIQNQQINSLQYFGRLSAILGAIIGASVFIILRNFQSDKNVSILVSIQYVNLSDIILPSIFMVQQGVEIMTLKDIIFLILAYVIQFLGQYFSQRGLKFVGAGEAAVYNYTIVLYSYIYDIFYKGYALQPSNIIGLLLIITAAFIQFMKNNQKQQ